MKTVIKAIFSVLFSYIFLLYMKIPINGMIIIGVGIAFYKIWMTKKDFDRIDDKLSYIAFSLLLSISIVLSKHIHPDECNPFATFYRQIFNCGFDWMLDLSFCNCKYIKLVD